MESVKEGEGRMEPQFVLLQDHTSGFLSHAQAVGLHLFGHDAKHSLFNRGLTLISGNDLYNAQL